MKLKIELSILLPPCTHALELNCFGKHVLNKKWIPLTLVKPMTCTCVRSRSSQENKALKIQDCVAYWFSLYWHSKVVHISMNVPTFTIIIQEIFIVHHWLKHSCVPKYIRNRIITRRVENGLNFLSYDETEECPYGLRQVCHRWVHMVHVALW